MMSQNQPAAAALSTAVPSLALDEVRALVGRLYGIDGSVKPLAGERDQNCCIETADGRRYVFKISNPSEPVSVVDFQIAALQHIARVSPDQPVPRVVRTLAGRSRDTVTLPGGVQTTVRMLTYLEGIQIRETPRTAGQRRAMGRVLAELNLALRDFSHTSATHDLLWNVSAAHRLTAKLDAIEDTQRRALAESFMTRFTDHVLPRLDSVRAQVIHNDYHLYNVLVAPDDHERVVGIIDFGDMLHAPLVGVIADKVDLIQNGPCERFFLNLFGYIPLQEVVRGVIFFLKRYVHQFINTLRNGLFMVIEFLKHFLESAKFCFWGLEL
jgi:Ser/Thr protein kinase RdoA (MazF antagonist)